MDVNMGIEFENSMAMSVDMRMTFETTYGSEYSSIQYPPHTCPTSIPDQKLVQNIQILFG